MGFIRSFKDRVSHKNEDQKHDTPADDQRHSQNIQQSSDRKQGIESNKESTQSHTDSKSSHLPTQPESYQPPPGAPPTYQSKPSTTQPDLHPPPYESWLAVPDASQLPPPPALSNEHSTANNATFSSAAQGHAWCARNPVYTPSIPSNSAIIEASQSGHLGFDPPPHHFKGTIKQLSTRKWAIQTPKSQQDTTLTSTLPIYFAAISNPLSHPSRDPTPTPTPTSISYTLQITHTTPTSSIAMGYTSNPYPTFRLPGWHRASLAVHSDDGNRYTNDPHGGVDFTSPLESGDVVRLTMTISPVLSPVQVYRGKYRDVRVVGGGLPKCRVEVGVERNGRVEGGWVVSEERDGERDEGVEGLQGEADLYVAVGVFGDVGFVVEFEGVCDHGLELEG